MRPILKKIVTLLAIVLVAFGLFHKVQALLNGQYIALFVLVFYTMLLVLFIIRKPAESEVTGIKHWLACMGGTFLSFAMAPFSTPFISETLAYASLPFLLVGIIISTIALFNLGKGFGVIAAHRDIKTQGLYQYVRHPLYLGEALWLLAIVIQQLSVPVILIYTLQLYCQIIRIQDEENLLLKDPRYQEYAKKVAYKLLPFVY